LDALRPEFGDGDPGQNQHRTPSRAEAKPFPEEQERGEEGEDRLERQDYGGVGGGQKLLGPALDGERRGGCEQGRDRDGDDRF